MAVETRLLSPPRRRGLRPWHPIPLVAPDGYDEEIPPGDLRPEHFSAASTRRSAPAVSPLRPATAEVTSAFCTSQEGSGAVERRRLRSGLRAQELSALRKVEDEEQERAAVRHMLAELDRLERHAARVPKGAAEQTAQQQRAELLAARALFRTEEEESEVRQRLRRHCEGILNHLAAAERGARRRALLADAPQEPQVPYPLQRELSRRRAADAAAARRSRSDQRPPPPVPQPQPWRPASPPRRHSSGGCTASHAADPGAYRELLCAAAEQEADQRCGRRHPEDELVLGRALCARYDEWRTRGGPRPARRPAPAPACSGHDSYPPHLRPPPEVQSAAAERSVRPAAEESDATWRPEDTADLLKAVERRHQQLDAAAARQGGAARRHASRAGELAAFLRQQQRRERGPRPLGPFAAFGGEVAAARRAARRAARPTPPNGGSAPPAASPEAPAAADEEAGAAAAAAAAAAGGAHPPPAAGAGAQPPPQPPEPAAADEGQPPQPPEPAAADEGQPPQLPEAPSSPAVAAEAAAAESPDPAEGPAL
eukprot:TRINITY_DN2618_c0_g1_i2.p1 TRINITY_DN2618_c0_g1~~TRINITY_DN2618_c0_g1_i2.p1  ORF type:complete len:541 (+),score=135.36 TRINITY_DN2618_c0_g1_i2:80-1702(+)